MKNTKTIFVRTQRTESILHGETLKVKLILFQIHLTENPGMDCKMIGPASMCLCGHRYRDHNYINPVGKKVHCKASKCTCPCFYSVPVRKILLSLFRSLTFSRYKDGSQDFKCLCKGSYSDHDPVTKKCPKV